MEGYHTKNLQQNMLSAMELWRDTTPRIFSLINPEFISRTNHWIRCAISRNVEEVDLRLWDAVGGMIEKILFGSPLLESLELNYCYGFSRIDITSKSVKKLVFSRYNCRFNPYEEDYIDCAKIDAPYISSPTIEGELFLRELVLLNVSSLVEVDLKYSISFEEPVIFAKEIFRGLLESLGHVEDITFGDHCSDAILLMQLLSCLKAGSDTSDDDRAENGD
nr:hypothetical protein [Tanacetum cinerariifolium]